MEQTTIVTYLGSAVALLLSGNLYFIKRLVDKVEITAESSHSAATTAQLVASQMAELKAEVKDLRRVEIDVAILKGHLGLRVNPINPDPS
jgi:hypothetical protein